MNLLILKNHNLEPVLKKYSSDKGIIAESIKRILKGDRATLDRGRYIKKAEEENREEDYWGWTEEYEKKYRKALTLLRECIKGNVSKSDVFALMGYVSLRLCQFPDAIGYYLKAIKEVDSEKMENIYLLKELKGCVNEYIRRIKDLAAGVLIVKPG